MKKCLFAALALWLMAAAGCDQHKSLTSPQPVSAGFFSLGGPSGPGNGLTAPAAYSRTIPIDTANRMIQSYLDAIDYTVNTNAIRSWVFNADTLRNYLNSAKGKDIRNLRLLLAHSLEYIHAGHEGVMPPLNSHDLTLVIVGLDENNDYIYSSEGGPLDRCMPCPTECLPDGEGSGIF